MPVAALLPIALLAVAFVAFCEWDLSRSRAKHLPRWVWAIVIVGAVPLGGLLWLTVGKDET